MLLIIASIVGLSCLALSARRLVHLHELGKAVPSAAAMQRLSRDDRSDLTAGELAHASVELQSLMESLASVGSAQQRRFLIDEFVSELNWQLNRGAPLAGQLARVALTAGMGLALVAVLNDRTDHSSALLALTVNVAAAIGCGWLARKADTHAGQLRARWNTFINAMRGQKSALDSDAQAPK